MNIGNRVKELRKERELTQTELAERAELAYRTISNIELNKYQPRMDTLRKIALALGLKSPRQLLDGK